MTSGAAGLTAAVIEELLARLAAPAGSMHDRDQVAQVALLERVNNAASAVQARRAAGLLARQESAPRGFLASQGDFGADRSGRLL